MPLVASQVALADQMILEEPAQPGAKMIASVSHGELPSPSRHSVRQQNDYGCADSNLASSERACAASRNAPSEGASMFSLRTA